MGGAPSRKGLQKFIGTYLGMAFSRVAFHIKTLTEEEGKDRFGELVNPREKGTHFPERKFFGGVLLLRSKKSSRWP